MKVVLHSSKTMHALAPAGVMQSPVLLGQAIELAAYITAMPRDALQKSMQISSKLTPVVQQLYAQWSPDIGSTACAIDTFVGDIYSGLQTHTWTTSMRDYANDHLYILSGLYGILRPLDGVRPYRLEMGYKFPDNPYKNLYDFWSDSIAATLSQNETYINLAAVEYSKVVTKYLTNARWVTPKFLTISPKTGEPVFVVVHAKIARGAFAHWMMRHQIQRLEDLMSFSELGYRHDPEMSTDEQPVFICKEFQGLGLSVRLRA